MLLLDQPKLHTSFTGRNRLVKAAVEFDAITYLHPLVISFIAPVVQPQVSPVLHWGLRDMDLIFPKIHQGKQTTSLQLLLSPYLSKAKPAETILVASMIFCEEYSYKNWQYADCGLTLS